MRRRLKSRTAKIFAIAIPVIVVAGLVALVYPRLHQTAATPTPPAAHAQLKPDGFQLGVRVRKMPGPWNPVTTFSQAVGASPQLVLYYSGWFEPFQLKFAKEAYAHHATVVVQIQPWGDLKKISDGHYDHYLRSFASNVRNFRHPVVIGFGHEMNGKWYKWGFRHQSPASFVLAWQHIVNVFRRQGADNVTWLWTISSSVVPPNGPPLGEYYPGDQYVTWVGLDGYYYKKTSTFTTVFGPAIGFIRQITSKPILLAETGIGPVSGQARNMPNLFSGIKQNHILGLVWYDVTQHRGLYHQDWRLDGHPAALAAFRRGVAQMLNH